MKATTLLAPKPPDIVQSGVDRLLTCKQVEALVGRCRRTLMRWVAVGEFQPPIRLSTGRIGWRESEVKAWIESREPGAVRPEVSNARRKNGLRGNAIRWNWPSEFDGVEHHWIRL